MKTIVKMIFGSHLYGTNTLESDQDFKGIFLPSKEDIYLNRIFKSITTNTKKGSNSKNTSEDIDTEMYSLHYFFKLACEGQTVALDMLHAPKECILESSDIWDKIVENRNKFYTKNLDAFVSYAHKQAAKYGCKGSRLNDAKKVLDFFDNWIIDQNNLLADITFKLRDIWNELPEGEHIIKHSPDSNGIRMYEVCNRKIGETATIEYAYKVINTFYENYGERARKAADNEGIDYKSISHAFRAAFQVKEILTEGTITFPLKKKEFLIKVKKGELDYNTEIAPYLDKLMLEVDELSKNSNLPEKVDRNYWNRFLINTVEESLKQEVLYCD